MDDQRFDRLTRTLSSRRTAISRFVASGTMAMLGLWTATASAACPRGKKRYKGQCIAKRACCTKAHCRPKNSGKSASDAAASVRPARNFAGDDASPGLHPAPGCPPPPARMREGDRLP